MKVTPGERRGLILLSILIVLLLAYGVYDRRGNAVSTDIISPVADSVLPVGYSVSLVPSMRADSDSLFPSSSPVKANKSGVKQGIKRNKKPESYSPRSPLDQPIN